MMGFVIDVPLKREPGLWNFICCRPNGKTRRWYYFYQTYRIGRELAPELGRLHILRWVWSLS